MYADGTQDLMAMIMMAAFKPPEEKEENIALIVTKAKTRYFPVFEKVGCRDPTLVGPSGVAGALMLQRPLRTQILWGGAGGEGVDKGGADLSGPPSNPPLVPERKWRREGRSWEGRREGGGARQVPTSPSQAAGIQALHISDC